MAYSINPNIEKSRGKAIYDLLVNKVPLLIVARKWGVNRVTIWRWLQKWQELNANVSQECINRPKRKTTFCPSYYRWLLKTKSSAPKTHPQRISLELEKQIVQLRKKYGRCSEVILWHLKQDGIVISLSTIKRILERNNLLNKGSKWEKYHRTLPRPKADNPGNLVEVDTVHYVNQLTGKRTYITTVIDLNTRMAYARCASRLLPGMALKAVLEAQDYFGFKINTIQSDNGPEFSSWFSSRLNGQNIIHRHTRIHRPNDNAHIERFNRTLRQECIGEHMKSNLDVAKINKILNDYIDFYNNKRIHLGIQCLTPIEMLQR